MKKIVICNIPMRKEIAHKVYESKDSTLHVSPKAVMFPVNSFLAENLNNNDQLKVILLVKKDKNDYYATNTKAYIDELNSVNETVNANIEYVQIETDFNEEKTVHEKLMGSLVDEIGTGSHLIADITYGPKDLPLVVFSALHFAEKFLACQIDNIIYGQGFFNEENEVVQSEICDMAPLYYLSSVTEMITCNESTKARKLLKTLLNL